MNLRHSMTPISLLLSLALHSFLVYGALEKLASLPPLIKKSEDEPIMAELVDAPIPKQSSREIAPPSEARETDTPPADAKLGEKNTITEKESIRRGTEEGPKGENQPAKAVPSQPTTPKEVKAPEKKSPPVEKTTRAPEKQERPKTQPQKSEPKNPVLKLGENDVLAKLGPGTLTPSGKESGSESWAEEKDRKEGPSDAERSTRFLSVQPFRKSGSGILQPGVSDVLNNVPDGEITVLNEKADQFAVFVRRVANQVFGALRRTSWAKLSAPEVEAIRKYGRVRAVLSPKGKLMRVEVLDGSGSILFDELLNDSVEIGANDQNPPKEALAPDGNFRFIFIARTWTRRAPNNISEQRWIVLGTGLE